MKHTYYSLLPSRTRPIRRDIACLFMMTLVIFSLKAGADPGKSHEPVTRLHFAKGQRRISVIGSLGVSKRAQIYSFYARSGQRLKIDLEDLKPRGHNPDAYLVSTYHITFPSGKQYGMKGYEPFDGRLTETGLYHLTIDINLMASNSTHGRYRLTLRR